tara:strand:- start:706 stop:906 length:201 start_codon:yes stop_codon:yes gene_type:complete
VSILSSYIKKQLKKHGFAGFVMKVGDVAVKLTPNPADDILWDKIRKALRTGKVSHLMKNKDQEISE